MSIPKSYDHVNEDFDMNLDARIAKSLEVAAQYLDNPDDCFNQQTKQIKALLRDVLAEVKPENVHEQKYEQFSYNHGWDAAIDQLEANVKELGL